MAEPIVIAPSADRYCVRVGDFVIGETGRALVLVEAGHDPVVYVPRGDMDLRKLEPTDRHTTCPWKGEASYFSVLAPGGRLDNVVWSYEAPIPACAEIAGHLAFYPAVTVEKL